MEKWQQVLSAVAGITFLTALLTIALFVPNPTGFQEFVFRTVLSLSAGAFATILSGFIHLDVQWQKITLRAGAGLAVFFIVYHFNPPRLIKEISGPTGFISPTTARSGDSTMAVVVPPDGTALALLPDDLSLDLQGDSADLNGSVSVSLMMGIIRDSVRNIESVTNHIRGFIALSEGSRATIILSVGGRTLQYSYPFGAKSGMEFRGGLYEDEDFLRSITTPVDWRVGAGEVQYYPIMLTIVAERRSKAETVLITIDSLDALLNSDVIR
jgi:hypothetical protein